jgi:shikimate kinase
MRRGPGGALAPANIVMSAPRSSLSGKDLGRPIVMVGMMGAGKSAIGRRLAQRLALPFVDADTEIERAAGCSVAEIFDRHGEAAFRDGERRVIARLLDGGPSVIATGGGAFVQPATQALINRQGIAIWLDSDVDTLVDRVTRKDTRPLLRGGDPKAIVAKLKAEREAAYAQAPVKVMSDAGPQGEAVKRILKALNEWL